MGLFEDFSRFLETRLEEFLRDHPDLELQALEEQLRQQEEDTLRLIADLQREEKKCTEEILAIAQDIQKWHKWVAKAQAANRPDLAEAAQEREASLLRQGNQRWGQMQGVKNRIEKSKELYRQIQQRRKEVKIKQQELAANRAKATQTKSWETQGWNQGNDYTRFQATPDPLEQQFRQWEMDEELEQLKRNMRQ